MTLLITTLATLMEILGIISAFSALLNARTSQGAVAWVVSLLTFPVIAVPIYWIFGRTKFRGYVDAKHTGDMELHHITRNKKLIEGEWAHLPDSYQGQLQALDKLAKLPFTTGNNVQLLIDGEATFDSIFQGIEEAKNYILVQFFIVHDDVIGRALKEKLIKKAQQGVRIYFLYDEIGSHSLPRTYLDNLQKAGIQVSSFHSTRGIWNRFQINFRNHRKIVVVDGRVAWIGGHNVGDEYLGRSRKFGHWRDTHIRLQGPAVMGAQISFLEDWYWATEEKLELDWDVEMTQENVNAVLVMPSGPADEYDTASLMIQQAIQAATERFWIATPYFVPDEGVMQALHLAALRGVDVRVLIPDKPDHLLPFLSAYSFVGDMIQSGVKIYRYQYGFMHQKVFLLDRVVAAVGTVNLDNRSLHLNFEITVICLGEEFSGKVEKMLHQDFGHARKMTLEEIKKKPLLFKLLSRAAYLAAPVQ